MFKHPKVGKPCVPYSSVATTNRSTNTFRCRARHLDHLWVWTMWTIFLVQTKMSWRTLFIIWYSRQLLGIKVQSCPMLRSSHK